MRVRKTFERPEGKRTAKLVIIAAEGRITENLYFEEMKERISATNVHVEVLQRDTNNSSPKSVYEQIQSFKQQYIIEQDDELWIVIDRDKWKNKTLSSVARYCIQDKNLRFCVSNPCFELWLLLHLEDVNTYSQTELDELQANRKNSRRGCTLLKAKMKALMTHYSESDYDTNELLPHVRDAIARAARLDTNKQDRWPQTVGTRVYKLANSILGK